MFEPRPLGLRGGHRSDRHGVIERHTTLALSRSFLDPMSLGWKRCSTFTPKDMIQSDPSYALMKARISSSARFARRFRPSWASRNAMTANTGATGRLISLSSSTRIDPGAGSRTEQRTAQDFAACMRDLVDLHYPHAD